MLIDLLAPEIEEVIHRNKGGGLHIYTAAIEMKHQDTGSFIAPISEQR